MASVGRKRKAPDGTPAISAPPPKRLATPFPTPIASTEYAEQYGEEEYGEEGEAYEEYAEEYGDDAQAGGEEGYDEEAQEEGYGEEYDEEYAEEYGEEALAALASAPSAPPAPRASASSASPVPLTPRPPKPSALGPSPTASGLATPNRPFAPVLPQARPPLRPATTAPTTSTSAATPVVATTTTTTTSAASGSRRGRVEAEESGAADDGADSSLQPSDSLGRRRRRPPVDVQAAAPQKSTLVELIRGRSGKLSSLTLRQMEERKQQRIEKRQERLRREREDPETPDEGQALAARPRPEPARSALAELDDLPAPRLAPRLAIVDGRVVVDQASLVVAQAPRTLDLSNRTAITEVPRHITSASFRKTPLTQRWNEEEKVRFVEALRKCGTDFTMIEKFFPGRTRGQIRNYYKKLERANPLTVADALANRTPLDIDEFRQLNAQFAKRKRQLAGEDEEDDQPASGAIAPNSALETNPDSPGLQTPDPSALFIPDSPPASPPRATTTTTTGATTATATTTTTRSTPGRRRGDGDLEDHDEALLNPHLL